MVRMFNAAVFDAFAASGWQKKGLKLIKG